MTQVVFMAYIYRFSQSRSRAFAWDAKNRVPYKALTQNPRWDTYASVWRIHNSPVYQ